MRAIRGVQAIFGALSAGILAVASLSGCAPSTNSEDDAKVNVVATTALLADLVRNVAGEDAEVSSIVPPEGDPHSYEPTLRDVRKVAYADLAFSNYLLLEAQAIVRTLDANLRPGTPNIALAEAAVPKGATVIPLVENHSLDTVWLGLRVAGDASDRGAGRMSSVRMSVTNISGPGHAAGYMTETFGQPSIFFASRDGFDPSNGYRDDSTELPIDAHTHMSWAFTNPGIYRIDMRAALYVTEGARPYDLGSTQVTFAVGVDPAQVAEVADMTPLDAGHADITVDLSDGDFSLLVDREGSDGPAEHMDLASTVVVVPSKALTTVPADPAFSFIDRPGAPTYMLAQAVLGRHVHGEIDPHLWQDIRNVAAYVEVIRDQLMAADPANAGNYARRARKYTEQLSALDADVSATIATIPRANRHLVTTHDAYAYLAKAYGLEVVGFVTPNPAIEPSVQDRTRLASTLRDLHVPAVFLEPTLVARSSELRQTAADSGIEVCPIYGDAFDKTVTNYVEMMRFNATSLARCLGGDPDEIDRAHSHHDGFAPREYGHGHDHHDHNHDHHHDSGEESEHHDEH